MFNYTRRGKRADFGNLGVDPGDYASQEHKETNAKPDSAEDGGGISSILQPLVAGGAGGLSGLCSCANKDKQAEADKKAELETKYPTRDCGANPTQACLDYNKSQLAKRDAEYNDWLQSKDAQIAEALPDAEKQRFAFVAALAEKLKVKHPEAGSMTLSEIYKRYPDDFDAIYKELQGQYPFLKNIDPATALAMNPGVSNMTLDQLIQKTRSISGMGASPSGGVSTTAAVGLGALVLGGAALFALLKRRE